MASKRELARWRLLYELLLKGGTDHETICRIWPKLTLVPLEDAEYALAEWDDIRPAVRVLQTGEACVRHACLLARAPEQRTCQCTWMARCIGELLLQLVKTPFAVLVYR